MTDKYGFLHKGTGEQIRARETEEVTWLYFPALEAVPGLIHGFSTRLGGVSTGVWSSMNLSFTRGDDEAHVRENYRRIARAVNWVCHLW